MNAIIQWWRKRQLRLARERYAEFKARREAYQILISNRHFLTGFEQDKMVGLSGKEARYLERVEELMRG